MIWSLFLNNAIVWGKDHINKQKENMERKLLVQVDNKKTIKNSEGHDVEITFSMSIPYGIPFALAAEALNELMKEFETMANEAEAILKKAQESKAEEVKS